MAFVVVVGQRKRPGRQIGHHHPGACRGDARAQGSPTLCWATVPVPNSGGRRGGLVNTGDWRGRPAPVVVVGEVLPVGALNACNYANSLDPVALSHVLWDFIYDVTRPH